MKTSKITTLIAGILLIMCATVAVAAPVSTWSGAGPNACHGQCDQDWAESQLTAQELEELNQVRASQPLAQPIEIQDGDVFRLATYFKNDAPIAYRTTTVAVLDEPTGAMGWHMDGWSWVKLDACSNWTLVEHQGIYPNATPVPQRVVTTSPPVWTSTIVPPSTYIWTTPTPDPWTPPTTYIPDPDPEMPAVPLPPSLVMLLLALGSFLIIKRRQPAYV